MKRKMTKQEAYEKLLDGDIRLRYDVDAAFADDESAGVSFTYVYCWCPALGESRLTGHCIITNARCRGRWVANPDGTLHQTHGTLQFSLPRSASGIKRLLRSEYLGKLGWEQYLC